MKKTEKKDNEATANNIDPDVSIIHEQFSDEEEQGEETAIDLIDHPGDEEDETPSNADKPEEEPDPSDNDDPVDGEVVDCAPGGAKWKVLCSYYLYTNLFKHLFRNRKVPINMFRCDNFIVICFKYAAIHGMHIIGYGGV